MSKKTCAAVWPEPGPDREQRAEVIKAATQLAEQIGVSAACQVLGMPHSTFYRARQPKSEAKPRPVPERALQPEEKAQVLQVLNSEPFHDCAPREVYAALLDDQQQYLCSWRTMYRILKEHEQVRERRGQILALADDRSTLLGWSQRLDTTIYSSPAIGDLDGDGDQEVIIGAHVGTGPDEQGLRALAVDLGVSARVTFAGQVDDDALAACYQACDLFVMPTHPSDDGSEVEGFGIVYLEAGAAGKPVIGGQAGGVASAVLDGETGLLADPRDHESVAEAVLRLLLDPTMARRLGEKGQAHVRHAFSDQRFAAQVTDVLERAVRGRQKDRMTADSAFSG